MPAGVTFWGVAGPHVFPDLFSGDAIECCLVYRPTGVVLGLLQPLDGFLCATGADHYLTPQRAPVDAPHCFGCGL